MASIFSVTPFEMTSEESSAEQPNGQKQIALRDRKRHEIEIIYMNFIMGILTNVHHNMIFTILPSLPEQLG